MSEITDSDRMEFLEEYFMLHRHGLYARVHLRGSSMGRGARLHHTKRAEGWKPNFRTVREAIDHAMSNVND